MKNYIGSGKKHDSYNVVKVTIDLEKAKDFIYEYKGKKYLTFDVAERRETDQFGKTHTVSVWTPDNQNNNQSNGNQPKFDDIPNNNGFDDLMPF